MKKIYGVILSLTVLTAGLLFLFSSDSEAQVDPLAPPPPSFTLPAGMEFVTIPSGSFQMGSPSSESGRDSDESQHRVSVGSFELMTTEVTQGMWEEVMGDNPAYDFSYGEDYGVGDNYPVYFVSWNSCQDFIDELNDLDASHTYRLPSEAEWEYACRAGTTTPYYWGTEMDGDYCWYSSNSNLSTHPVGTKEPNTWGLYDMSGNVYEWCEDWYHGSYDGAPTNGSAWTSGGGSFRVYRGGVWHYDEDGSCRSADHFNLNPCSLFAGLGFRLARSVL